MINPQPALERIWAEKADPDAWHCLCGNQPCDGGFYPCDAAGNEIEPVIGDGWKSLYVCFDCGRIIDADTLLVLDRSAITPAVREGVWEQPRADAPRDAEGAKDQRGTLP